MNKTRALKILNPILAVLFLNQSCTGLIHGALPHEAYELLHGGGGIVLMIAVWLHVYLNWNWIRANFLKS